MNYSGYNIQTPEGINLQYLKMTTLGGGSYTISATVEVCGRDFNPNVHSHDSILFDDDWETSTGMDSVGNENHYDNPAEIAYKRVMGELLDNVSATMLSLKGEIDEAVMNEEELVDARLEIIQLEAVVNILRTI